MAEAFARALVGNRFDVVSTAVKSSSLHPLLKDVMSEVGIDISTHDSETVAESLKDRFHYVITIYDVTKERHPIFPFTPHLLHWSVVDPLIEGTDEEKLQRLRAVRDEIKEKVLQFLAEAKPDK